MQSSIYIFFEKILLKTKYCFFLSAPLKSEVRRTWESNMRLPIAVWCSNVAFNTLFRFYFRYIIFSTVFSIPIQEQWYLIYMPFFNSFENRGLHHLANKCRVKMIRFYDIHFMACIYQQSNSITTSKETMLDPCHYCLTAGVHWEVLWRSHQRMVHRQH